MKFVYVGALMVLDHSVNTYSRIYDSKIIMEQNNILSFFIQFSEALLFLFGRHL